MFPGWRQLLSAILESSQPSVQSYGARTNHCCIAMFPKVLVALRRQLAPGQTAPLALEQAPVRTAGRRIEAALPVLLQQAPQSLVSSRESFEKQTYFEKQECRTNHARFQVSQPLKRMDKDRGIELQLLCCGYGKGVR